MPGPVTHLLNALAAPDGPTPDGELLRRYTGGDAAAFELLVRRYAPLVGRVCRGVLADAHAAEDARQAVFLVLANKAGRLSGGTPLAGWLCRVAYRAAGRLRAKNRPVPVPVPDRPPVPDPAAVAVSVEEARAVQDAVARLPDRYHAPVVLCFFDGLTQTEAAARLGWPVGTVAGRLSRAKGLLRSRLARHELPVTAAGLALPDLISAAGPSPAAVELSREVMRAMFFTKLRIAAGCLAVGLLAVGLVATAGGTDPPKPEPKKIAPPMKDEQLAKEKKFIAEGKVVQADGTTPMVGVKVYASAGMGSLRTSGETITDKDGKYRLIFTPGILVGGGGSAGVAIVGVWKTGWHGWCYGTRPVYLLSDEPLPPDQQEKGYGNLQPGVPVRLDFRMQEAASLRARLTDAAGKPMANAYLVLTGENLRPGGSVIAAGKTDTDGMFTATEIPRSRYRLILEGPNRADLELGSIQFRDAVEYRVDVQLHEWTPAATSFTTRIKAGEAKK